MGNSGRTLPENTAGLRLAATKLTFVPRNKQEPHHAQTFGATELHSVGQERPMIIPHRSSSGFPENFQHYFVF